MHALSHALLGVHILTRLLPGRSGTRASRSILRAHAYPFSDDDVDVLEGISGTALALVLFLLSDSYSSPRFLSLDSCGVLVP